MSLPHFSKSLFWNVGQVEDLANGLVISLLCSPASSLDFLNMKLQECTITDCSSSGFSAQKFLSPSSIYLMLQQKTQLTLQMVHLIQPKPFYLSKTINYSPIHISAAQGQLSLLCSGLMPALPETCQGHTKWTGFSWPSAMVPDFSKVIGTWRQKRVKQYCRLPLH